MRGFRNLNGGPSSVAEASKELWCEVVSKWYFVYGFEFALIVVFLVEVR